MILVKQYLLLIITQKRSKLFDRWEKKKEFNLELVSLNKKCPVYKFIKNRFTSLTVPTYRERQVLLDY